MTTIEVHRPTSSTRAQRSKQRAWGVTILLFAFFSLNFVDKAVIGLASDQIRDEFGISSAQFGLLGSAFFWLFAVGAIVFTWLFKKTYYTWAAAFLMLAWLVCLAPAVFPISFGGLLASRIVLGFVEGPTHALCQSTVADLFGPNKRAFAGAVVNAGSSVGPLVAAPILTWIIITFSWHTAFGVLAACAAAWLVCWQLYVDRFPLRRAHSSAAAAPIEDEAGTDQATGEAAADVVVPFGRLLALRSFWGLAMACFAGYLISALEVTWLPAYLHKALGYSHQTAGNLMVLPYLAAIAVLLGAGLLSGWLMRRGHTSHVARGRLTAVLLVIGGLAMALFTRLQPGPFQLTLVVIAFAVNSVPFSIAFHGASDFLPAKQRTAFFGCIVGVYSLAGIAAPYVLGLVVEHAKTPAAGYAQGFLWIGFVIAVLGGVGGLLVNPERARATLERVALERSVGGAK